MLLLWYPKCSTCQKAKKWLDGHSIAAETRDIVSEHPNASELKSWHQRSGLPLKRFFNTSGLKYRALNLSQSLPDATEEEMLNLLQSDGMLVKRPLLIGESFVLIGFREKEWLKTLKP